MRLLITGGAGFIGSQFVRSCFDGTFADVTHVTVLDKLTYAGSVKNLEKVNKEENFRFVLGDICDQRLVSSEIKNIDAVINFAAESHVDRSIESSNQFINTNIVGLNNLLNSLKDYNPKARFLQVSTDEVYGSIEYGSASEDYGLNPSSPYSASKAAGDLLALAFCHTFKLDIMVTRGSNNYGSHQFPEKMIPLFITNALEGKKIPIYGNGQNIRNWIHVKDHCMAIYEILLKGKSSEVYNIGGNIEMSNSEVANLIIQKLDLPSTLFQYVEDRPGHDYRYSLNSTKLKNVIGFEPVITFLEGIEETIYWYKNNKSWWQK
jgi:dTDP-glucose 4,6-dehydratase